MKSNAVENSEPISLVNLGLPANLPTGDASSIGFTFEVQEPDNAGVKNERWIRVMNLVESHTPSDWRQAIIEADIILGRYTLSNELRRKLYW